MHTNLCLNQGLGASALDGLELGAAAMPSGLAAPAASNPLLLFSPPDTDAAAHPLINSEVSANAAFSFPSIKIVSRDRRFLGCLGEALEIFGRAPFEEEEDDHLDFQLTSMHLKEQDTECESLPLLHTFSGRTSVSDSDSSDYQAFLSPPASPLDGASLGNDPLMLLFDTESADCTRSDNVLAPLSMANLFAGPAGDDVLLPRRSPALRGYNDPILSAHSDLNPAFLPTLSSSFPAVEHDVDPFAPACPPEPPQPLTVTLSDISFAKTAVDPDEIGLLPAVGSDSTETKLTFDVMPVRAPRASPQTSRANRTPFVQFNAPEPDGPTQEQINAAKAKRLAADRAKASERSRSTKSLQTPRGRRNSAGKPDGIVMDRQIQVISFAENNKALTRTIELPSDELTSAQRTARAARKAAARKRRRGKTSRRP